MTVNPATDDIFTPIVARLWEILEASTDFTTRVKASNRIKYTTQNPVKSGVLQAGDCPEVDIIPGNAPQDWAPHSKSLEIEPTFVITVLSGDMRLSWDDTNGNTQGINMLVWIITRLLCAAGDNLGLTYVTLSRIRTTIVLDTAASENRGHQGWAAMITLSTRLTIERSGDVVASVDEGETADIWVDANAEKWVDANGHAWLNG